jgi:hypothetical protein
MAVTLLASLLEVKSKEKLSRYRYTGAKRERKYNRYSYLTLTLDGVSGKSHAPVVFTSDNEPTVPIG